jgi:prevent-host-death family protein
MSQGYSIAEAKAQLSRLVHRAEEGQPIQLTRRGKAVAVVLSIDDYQQLVEPRKTSWDVVVRLRRSGELENLDLDPDEIFDIAKDPSPNTEISAW